MNLEDYFDWYDLLVNQVAGGEVVFIFLSFIVLAFLSIKFKFHNVIALTMFALWALIMSSFFSPLFPITVFLIGSFFYWGLSKIIRD